MTTQRPQVGWVLVAPSPAYSKRGSIRNDVTGENGDSNRGSWLDQPGLWSRTGIHWSFEEDNRLFLSKLQAVVERMESARCLSWSWWCKSTHEEHSWRFSWRKDENPSQLWSWLARKLFEDRLHVEGQAQEGRRRNWSVGEFSFAVEDHVIHH